MSGWGGVGWGGEKALRPLSDGSRRRWRPPARAAHAAQLATLLPSTQRGQLAGSMPGWQRWAPQQEHPAPALPASVMAASRTRYTTPSASGGPEPSPLLGRSRTMSWGDSLCGGSGAEPPPCTRRPGGSGRHGEREQAVARGGVTGALCAIACLIVDEGE